MPILQVVTLVLVAVGVSLTLAHALEMPGKMRLGKDNYVAVQSIYYPGFTIGAFFGEFGAIIATLLLLIATPSDTLAHLLSRVIPTVLSTRASTALAPWLLDNAWFVRHVVLDRWFLHAREPALALA